MKKRLLSFILIGLFNLCVLLQIAYAAPNRFVSTDGDSDVVNINIPNFSKGLSNGWYFGVYDSDMTGGLDLLEGKVGFESAQFKITYDNNEDQYILKVLSGLNKESELSLGNTPDFSFYFYNGEKYYEPTALWHLNPSDVNSLLELDLSVTTVYLIRYEDDTTKQNVFGLNLAPVPLPATIMLLGSSLMGLLIVGNRKKG